MNKKSWEEFRAAGLLWFINSILHVFGWAIVMTVENGVIINAFPARVEYRGFSEKDSSDGYLKVARYMKENAEAIEQEALK